MSDTTERDLSALWEKYSKTRDAGIKDELILSYLDLVKRVARKLSLSYSDHGDYEDILGEGVIGLIEAIERFDNKKGVKFESFGMWRIKGRMLDYMRKKDWASISLRRYLNKLAGAYEVLEKRLGRIATDEEVASYLGVKVEKVRDALQKSHMFSVVSYESIVQSDSGDSMTYEGMLAGDERDEVYQAVENVELHKVLSMVIQGLSQTERRVIELYYYEELRLREIAEILQLSESRISQIHSKTLMIIASRMAQDYGEMTGG